jgi:thiol-disulfide isomerase/thioredoxin
MQKTITILAAAVMLGGCNHSREGSFELKGKLTEGNGETIYLEKLVNPQPILVDSTSLDEEGNFEFKNYTPKIGFYRIKTSQENFAMLVLDSADKISITGSVKDLGSTMKVQGSPETALFQEFTELRKANRFQEDSLKQAFQSVMASMKMDSLKMDSLSKIFQPVYEAITEKYFRSVAEKIKKNPDKYASLPWVQGMPPEKYEDVYIALDKGLSKKYPHDKSVKTMHDMIEKILSVAVGKEAPDIKLPTPEGKELSLSSFRGKLVLVDFWASWCAPCRKEMPNVVKVYKKYHDKNFEIFGVSLDQDMNRWVEAIKSDGITWPQVSDLKYWNSEVVKTYGIEGIPFTVLVDKDGKILAKGLRGPELEKAIENVLAGKSVSEVKS